jgi:sulfane dehydrogenase subunit SoxC
VPTTVERGVEQDYQRALPITEALAEDAIVALAMNGHPLPVQHGAPVRVLVPGWYGMAHVKWLVDISVRTEPFAGYENAVAYRVVDGAADTGVAGHADPSHALMVPPGFPDFQTRTRIVEQGTHVLTGRAWSGVAPVVARPGRGAPRAVRTCHGRVG